ncbi:hypothetical protein ACA910_000427 [Epithemia clementina (nom. ined.)]
MSWSSELAPWASANSLLGDQDIASDQSEIEAARRRPVQCKYPKNKNKHNSREKRKNADVPLRVFQVEPYPDHVVWIPNSESDADLGQEAPASGFVNPPTDPKPGEVPAAGFSESRNYNKRHNHVHEKECAKLSNQKSLTSLSKNDPKDNGSKQDESNNRMEALLEDPKFERLLDDISLGSNLDDDISGSFLAEETASGQQETNELSSPRFLSTLPESKPHCICAPDTQEGICPSTDTILDEDCLLNEPLGEFWDEVEAQTFARADCSITQSEWHDFLFDSRDDSGASLSSSMQSFHRQQ